MQPIN